MWGMGKTVIDSAKCDQSLNCQAKKECAVDAFKDELSEYKGAKGSVQFPNNKPLPYELVREIVKFRVAENMERAEGQRKKRK